MNLMKKYYHIFLFTIVLTILFSPAVSYDLIIPDTGQNFCYDWDSIMCEELHTEEGFYEVCDSDPCPPGEGEDFYGQDAHYTINPPDLTDNGDGTVTDNWTGLLWEQKTEENEPNVLSYNDATAYCENLSLGNSDNWRVPTRKEYTTLLNLGRLSPSLDLTYFPYYTATATTVYYWTASDYHDDPTKVWIMQLAFGIIEVASKEAVNKIRCVSGTPEPVANYTDNNNGTVTDNVTCLTWEQKTDDGSSRDKDTTFTWKDALAYCENLILGGFSDWRLPNPKELERIVDLERSNPAVDTTYFPNTKNGFYWTGTTCVGCHKFKAFAYDFSDGELYFSVKFRDGVYPENYVRCVTYSDQDDDGVICPNDNCPNTPNPLQEDTYPPQGNGIGDACDCESDFDCDGDVDSFDVTTFLTDFGRGFYDRPCANGNTCNGDFSCDGDVDSFDITKFLEDFGRGFYDRPCPACNGTAWCTY